MKQCRIAIVVLGTEGDVRPLVALGKGLRHQGYAVNVVTTADCGALAREEGLEINLLPGNFRALMAGEETLTTQKEDPFALARGVSRILQSLAPSWAREGKAACQDADLIIGAGAAYYLAASLAETLNKPCVLALLAPGMLVTALPLARGPLNVLMHHALMELLWQMSSPKAINSILRPQLGLRPYPWYGPHYRFRRQRYPVLFGFSQHVIPATTKLPEYARMTGYWFLDHASTWQPPEALLAFLERGPKPIYVGFGSISSRDAEATTAIIVEALRLSGKRAIVATGWGGLSQAHQLPAGDHSIFAIDHLPHDWLFPQVELAVHHGGAGTSAAAVRAGIPSVIVPFRGDQLLWAWRLEEIGVAPPKLPRKKLTAERLAEAIAQAGTETIRTRASQLGSKVRAEHGVPAAIKALQDWDLIPAARDSSTQEREGVDV